MKKKEKILVNNKGKGRGEKNVSGNGCETYNGSERKKKKVKFCVRKEDSVGCPKRAIS
jgi:hypothetical protein